MILCWNDGEQKKTKFGVGFEVNIVRPKVLRSMLGLLAICRSCHSTPGVWNSSHGILVPKPGAPSIESLAQRLINIMDLFGKQYVGWCWSQTMRIKVPHYSFGYHEKRRREEAVLILLMAMEKLNAMVMSFVQFFSRYEKCILQCWSRMFWAIA